MSKTSLNKINIKAGNKMSVGNWLIQRQEIGVIIPMVILIVLVGIINPMFLSLDNLTSIFRSTAFTAIIALGMTFSFIALELDLSVGAVVALSGVTTGLLLVNNCPIWLAIIGGILTGLICGLVTGYLIVHFQIPSMIGSLGMMFVIRGIVFVITLGNPLYPLPVAFVTLGMGSVFGIPIPALIFIIIALIFGYILKNTTYGRYIYAIGGNRETAWLCGINVERIKMSTYWVTGSLSGLVGVLLASRLSSAQPSAGTGWEMYVIASVIIGGTSMFGGVGTILGTVLGSILIGMLTNVLVMLNVSAYWQNVAIGTIILVAVIFDQFRKRIAISNTSKKVNQPS
jgi:ribose/xylose/arabinose/galactoside ABC-type transport system permease subunit